ncbi:choice-of-anchor D domain-containing protein [Streptomyces sp. NPDC001315]|uniref:choice-of-anchor D domain-containing protein n=1 Tax=Streptomyces sp. NPDC001315 TaxID=3364562 RepID=UPI0036ACE064
MPVEVHAPCGFGKTELLRSIAESEVGPDGRRLAIPRVYFEVGAKTSGDVLYLLVHKLYATDAPVKLSRAECARLVSGSRALLLLDDVPADPSFAGSLVDELPGCGLVFAGERPVLGGRATPLPLAGLSEEAALNLLSRDLGRRIHDHELPLARRLVTAVDGSPLQLRQAAALEREDPRRFGLDRLAAIAERDAAALDRYCFGQMSEGERRALAVLAAVGGAGLPPAVIGAMGDIAYVADFLAVLHGRGVVERADDRFGLPVCRAESFWPTLSRYVQLASAVRALADWIRSMDPTGPTAGSAVEAAVGLLGVAGERREWALVVRLVKVAEPVLFAQGRWEDWRKALDQGIDAAQQLGDRASEAFLTHQKGTLEYAEDRAEEAYRLLSRALELRSLAGDGQDPELTRHNLAIVSPPAGAGTRAWRQRARKTLTYVGTALAVIALVVGVQQGVSALLGRGSPGSGSSSPPTGTDVGTGQSGDNDNGGNENGQTSVGQDGQTSVGQDGQTSVGQDGQTSVGQIGQTTDGLGKKPTAKITPPTELTIAETTVGEQTSSDTVTLTNIGDAALSVQTAAITGPDATEFTVADVDCADASLEPQESCTLAVTFAPQTVGIKSATLTIPHSALTSPAQLTLTASAVERPDLLISAVEFTDGNESATITVHNDGGSEAPASLTAGTFDGVPLDSRPTGPIPAHGNTKVTFSLPEGCAEGCYYSVAADSDKKITELNEENNVKAIYPPRLTALGPTGGG